MSFIKGSSRILHPAESDGNQPQRLSRPKRELPSLLTVAANMYLSISEKLARPKKDMRFHWVRSVLPEFKTVPAFRVRISSSANPLFAKDQLPDFVSSYENPPRRSRSQRLRFN